MLCGESFHIQLIVSGHVILDLSLRRKVLSQEERLESGKTSGPTGLQPWCLHRNADAWAFGELAGALPDKDCPERGP